MGVQIEVPDFNYYAIGACDSLSTISSSSTEGLACLICLQLSALSTGFRSPRVKPNFSFYAVKQEFFLGRKFNS